MLRGANIEGLVRAPEQHRPWGCTVPSCLTVPPCASSTPRTNTDLSLVWKLELGTSSPLINQWCDLHAANSCPLRAMTALRGQRGERALLLAALPCLHAPVNQQATHSGPFISGRKWIIWKPFQQLFRLLRIACLQPCAPCYLLVLSSPPE